MPLLTVPRPGRAATGTTRSQALWQAVFACGAALLAALPAVAATPDRPQALALVLAVEGETAPALVPAQELFAGSIVLAPQTRLTIAHFESCQVATLIGGTIMVEAARFDATGEVAALRRRCPAQAQRPADAGSEAAGIALTAPPQAVPSGTLLRGAPLTIAGGGVPVIGDRPQLFVTGPGADQVTEVSIDSEQGLVVLLETAPHQFTWPAGQRPLPAGQSVAVVFEGPAGPKWRSREEFKVDPGMAEPAAVLIR